MRTLRPTPEIYAFYDGRVEGYSFGDAPNWVDEGALWLGIASHAIVDGDEALIYDTHISVDHARHVRRTLEQAGVKPVHGPAQPLASRPRRRDRRIRRLRDPRRRLTAELLARHREAIEDGSHLGPPATRWRTPSPSSTSPNSCTPTVPISSGSPNSVPSASAEPRGSRRDRRRGLLRWADPCHAAVHRLAAARAAASSDSELRD